MVANVENAAGGFGITASVLSELERFPGGCLDHGQPRLGQEGGRTAARCPSGLLRPANYPDGNPGRGWCVEETAAGVQVAVINLQGQAMMPPIDNAFRKADAVLDEIAAAHPDVKVILVDMHAEATSEKQAMGWYLDGRATAVLGTHTHVPTADERILPKGTAFQTDVGMTGPYESIIGMKPEKVLERFLYNTPRPFEPAKRDIQLRGALIDADETTGRATAIRRVKVDVG